MVERSAHHFRNDSVEIRRLTQENVVRKWLFKVLSVARTVRSVALLGRIEWSIVTDFLQIGYAQGDALKIGKLIHERN